MCGEWGFGDNTDTHTYPIKNHIRSRMICFALCNTIINVGEETGS